MENQNVIRGVDVKLSHLTKEFVDKTGKVTVVFVKPKLWREPRYVLPFTAADNQ